MTNTEATAPDRNRQTGRTTRMLRQVYDRANEEDVCVVGRDMQHASRLCRSFLLLYPEYRPSEYPRLKATPRTKALGTVRFYSQATMGRAMIGSGRPIFLDHFCHEE